MRVGLIASDERQCSTDPPRPDAGDHPVGHLGRRLGRRGAQVELLIRGSTAGALRSPSSNGLLVRRFSARRGAWRSADTGMNAYLRRHATSFDVIDVHTPRSMLALGAARSGLRPFVFTPSLAVPRLLRLARGRIVAAVVERADCVVCSSCAHATELCSAFPASADRVYVVESGVDRAAIAAAAPWSAIVSPIVMVAPLERRQRIKRAIAAMAALGPASRLVVLGEGPARRRLQAFAADLQVSDRVEFLGRVSPAARYRWLGSAAVVLALGEEPPSGRPVLEALAAGRPVIAADVPVHREFATRGPEGSVTLVPTDDSPLAVADAIAGAWDMGFEPDDRVPTREAAADATLRLYERLTQLAERRAPAARCELRRLDRL